MEETGVVSHRVFEAINPLMALSGAMGPVDEHRDNALGIVRKLELTDDELTQAYEQAIYAIRAGIVVSTMPLTKLRIIGTIGTLNDVMKRHFPGAKLRNPVMYVDREKDDEELE